MASGKRQAATRGGEKEGKTKKKKQQQGSHLTFCLQVLWGGKNLLEFLGQDDLLNGMYIISERRAAGSRVLPGYFIIYDGIDHENDENNQRRRIKHTSFSPGMELQN